MKAIATFSRLRQRAIPRQQALFAGLAIVGLWLLVACLAPWIAPFDPIAQDASSSLLPPGGAHLFGTDNFGRDVFSRVLWGARVDLQICLLGVLFPFMLGTTLGALAGYIGGVADALVMRVIDIVLAFPFLVLMLAIIAILGPGLSSFYMAMAMVGWVSYARLVRAQVLTLKTARFYSGGPQSGLRPSADFVPPSAAQCANRSHHFFDVRLRSGAAERGLGELSRARRAASYRRMGDYGGRRAELYHYRMVDNHLSGACHRAAGDGLQPAGRWAGR
ncbi:dipeptide transport system permease DppC [Klebsiella michiganensis]|uniref:Dipeptide transport system permease DppC n=1 Tax=Klebsiella michiganensis TaxID=1134687 RepID=A0A7H4MVF3_9ENTR|nr:dipeptide transport system permease DppC [Klebsiella michiganensis]